MDRRTFVRSSAKTVNQANAKATVTADQVTAADLRAQTGRPHRPAGIRPINDQARLEKSITKVVKDKPLRAKTQAEIDRSRRDRLGRLARNEPATAAQNTTQKALEHHQGLIEGWVRAVGGSAVCPLCQTWADGVVRSTKVHMVRHKGCRCMQRPVAKKGKKKPRFSKKTKAAATLFGTHAARAAAEEFATSIVLPGYYGRTGVLAGGRRAYRRLSKLETILKLGGPKLAAAAAEKRALIEAGVDVVRNTRDLEILDGGFVHHNDVYAFLDDLRRNDYTAEELDALWDYAGLYTDDPGGRLLSKGPVARYHEKLRNGEPLTAHEENVMRLVDQAIARNQTTRDVTVWRGALLPDEVAERLYYHAQPGERLTDKAPMFTGLTEARAYPHAARVELGEREPRTFKGERGVLFKMNVPKGMPAMHSPFGEALSANPGRLPFLPRAVPGLQFLLKRGGRQVSIPLRILPPLKHAPEFIRKRTVTLRIPFLEYFNKEELVLPRDTVLRFVSAKLRDDGQIIEIEVDVLKPTLSPPSPRRAGKVVGSVERPRSLQETLDELRGLFPQTRIEFPEAATHPLHAEQLSQALRGMALRYPKLAQVLERYEVTEDVPRLWFPPTGRFTAARLMTHNEIGLSGPAGGGIGQRHTIFNPWFAADPDYLRATLLVDPAQFAARDMEGIAVHELGHHVLYLLTDEIQKVAAMQLRAAGDAVWPDLGDLAGVNHSLALRLARAAVTKDLDQIVRAVTGHSMDSVEGIRAIEAALTKYAHNMGDHTDDELTVLLGHGHGVDIDELVAEAMTQVILGKYRRVGATVADLMEADEPSELAKAIVHYLDTNLSDLGVDVVTRPGGSVNPIGGASLAAKKPVKKPPPGRIASAKPTAATKAVPRAIGEGPAMHPNLIEGDKVVDTIRRQSQVPGFEDFAKRIRHAERSPVAGRVILRQMVARLAANMLDIAKRSMDLSPEATKLHAGWYPFARQWINQLADSTRVERVFHTTTDEALDSIRRTGLTEGRGVAKLEGTYGYRKRADAFAYGKHQKPVIEYRVTRGSIRRDLKGHVISDPVPQRDIIAIHYPDGRIEQINPFAPGVLITRHGVTAATAALSPGSDWADNVAWAQRMVEIIANQDTIRVERKWITRRYDLATARWEESIRTAKKESYRQKLLANPPKLRRDLIGKLIGDIDDPKDVALVIRGWHDAEPTYQLGGHAGFGVPENKTRPQSTDNLVKAVKVLRDGSIENIDATLGGQKVRSFFNNLTNPLDTVYLDVTGDSHHFGIANGIPWTSGSPHIASGARNVTETPWSGGTGVGGTYPLIAEATRIATRRFNALYRTEFLPNQFQSITWEMWRAMFPPGVRTDDLIEAMGGIHSRRARGEIGAARERTLIEQVKRSFDTPTPDEILEWFGNDLAGEPRLTMTELRKARRRRAKGK